MQRRTSISVRWRLVNCCQTDTASERLARELANHKSLSDVDWKRINQDLAVVLNAIRENERERCANIIEELGRTFAQSDENVHPAKLLEIAHRLIRNPV